MSLKGNISNTPNGVIGPIRADINVYHGVESDSTTITINNRKKEIKVNVKEEFLDNKQDKLTAGNNITIDENNVISAKGGKTYTAGEGIEITDENVINNTNNVIANPTLAGTEANLTSLQVGDTKYAVPQGGGETPHLYEITVQMGDNALISLRSLSKVAITNLMNITDETVITDAIWNELISLKDNLFCTSLQTISDSALLGGCGILFFEEEEMTEISIYAYINYPDAESGYYDGNNIEENSISIRKLENGYEVYCNGIRTPRNIICKQIF